MFNKLSNLVECEYSV